MKLTYKREDVELMKDKAYYILDNKDGWINESGNDYSPEVLADLSLKLINELEDHKLIED